MPAIPNPHQLSWIATETSTLLKKEAVGRCQRITQTFSRHRIVYRVEGAAFHHKRTNNATVYQEGYPSDKWRQIFK